MQDDAAPSPTVPDATEPKILQTWLRIVYMIHQYHIDSKLRSGITRTSANVSAHRGDKEKRIKTQGHKETDRERKR